MDAESTDISRKPSLAEVLRNLGGRVEHTKLPALPLVDTGSLPQNDKDLIAGLQEYYNLPYFIFPAQYDDNHEDLNKSFNAFEGQISLSYPQLSDEIVKNKLRVSRTWILLRSLARWEETNQQANHGLSSLAVRIRKIYQDSFVSQGLENKAPAKKYRAAGIQEKIEALEKINAAILDFFTELAGSQAAIGL